MYDFVNLLLLSWLTNPATASIILHLSGSTHLNTWKEDLNTKLCNYSVTTHSFFSDIRCVYAITRTVSEESYKISVYLDGESQIESVTTENEGVIFKRVKIKEGNNNITCKAEPVNNVTSNDNVTENNKSYTCVAKIIHPSPTKAPEPGESGGVIISGSSKLKFLQKLGQYSNIYNYNFTDREQANFNCYLDVKTRRELKNMIFYLDGKKHVIVNETHDGKLHGTFSLRKRNSNITCEAQDAWDNSSFFTSVVLLHYTYVGPVPDAMAASGVTATIVIIILLIVITVLIAVLLKFKRKVQVLVDNKIPAEVNRPALDVPSENVYDLVYSHGAGLRRPRVK